MKKREIIMNKRVLKAAGICFFALVMTTDPAVADVSGNMSDAVQAAVVVGSVSVTWVNFPDAIEHVAELPVPPEGINLPSSGGQPANPANPDQGNEKPK
jgi:hypothetical protein